MLAASDTCEMRKNLFFSHNLTTMFTFLLLCKKVEKSTALNSQFIVKRFYKAFLLFSCTLNAFKKFFFCSAYICALLVGKQGNRHLYHIYHVSRLQNLKVEKQQNNIRVKENGRRQSDANEETVGTQNSIVYLICAYFLASSFFLVLFIIIDFLLLVENSERTVVTTKIGYVFLFFFFK